MMLIWDIKDLSKQPPWGSNIAERITSLANYFYDGEDLFAVFKKAMDVAKKVNKELSVQSL
ncbi:Imm70 family immunity protein [Chryseobacterium lathyri]|uniref:Imm70 family immunity protein n=1 Tax=Chryseobacterium lathyri TaxID=395933 RepID=UPI00278B655D|nr:Imm70 family immunity protein [Chryseobacterium lathyri]MDQ0064990.1 hypothetical protein [Chryseobacterium lathyri]